MKNLNIKAILLGLTVILFPFYLMSVICGVIPVGSTYLSEFPQFSVPFALFSFIFWGALLYVATAIVSLLIRSSDRGESITHAVTVWALATVIVGAGLFIPDRLGAKLLLRLSDLSVIAIIISGNVASLWLAIKGGTYGLLTKPSGYEITQKRAV
jgi:hypothetical protein